jgi:SNF2 family DNA or RNA helicase
MNIMHGTWIPEETSEFIQPGGFFVWVEGNAPADSKRRSADDTTHPRHLSGEALAAFLTGTAGVHVSYPATLHRTFVTRHFLLPSDDDGPLPSTELLRSLGAEPPEAFMFRSWAVCCHQLDDAIAALNDIHFAALHHAEEYQLGADLRFWWQYTQAFKQIIARDQYIPALKYRALPPVAGKKGKGAERFELLPAWEILSERYDAAVREYAPAMPPACASGRATADAPAELYAPEALLRHFSEHLLREIVTGTPFTAAFDKQIMDTLLYDCVYPYRPGLTRQSSGAALTEYKAWLGWREKLLGGHATADFTLCFRLEEAESEEADDWRVHFLAAPKRDPSRKVSLAEYWSYGQRERAEFLRAVGRDFERHLLHALGYAARMYPKVWAGLETDRPVGFALSREEAFAFLKEDAWVLEDAGFTVIVPSWWTPAGRRRAMIRLKTSAHANKQGVAAAGNGLLNLDTIIAYEYQLSIGGEVVTEAEWRRLIDAKTPLVRFRGEWMELDRDKMRQMLDFWQTRALDRADLTPLDLMRITAEQGDEVEWDHDATVRAMMARLEDKSALAPVPDSPHLCGTLREYQRRGVAWLQYLESIGLNPCLADDMGLGKTLEVIARLLNEKENAADTPPTLIIAPTSVLSNWRREIERFAPDLRALVHQGSGRAKQEEAFRAACAAHDVVITSFAMARLDEKLLRGVAWQRVVVDEAQNIKNPQAAQTRAILKLPARHRMALTGTPVENRLLDLWSIFNFLNPGYLGKEAQFRKSFESPIQRGNDRERAATLKKLVEPFILRRVKTDKSIISDLPDKVEQKLFCNLTREQASLYEAVVKDVAERIEETSGMERRGLMLATLLRLKQICNHPAHFLQDGSAFTAERSHKLSRLAEMIEEVIESGESALVFSQFTEIGEALERYVQQTLRANTYYLHGGTSAKRREQMIAEFQDAETEPSVFLLSLRAGGVGITLTKANHVFHFDRWWNPAVEDQATDRAFRIGQRKNVFVHKFVAIGTVEERIDAMIEEKKGLAAAIVGADESWLTELDNDAFKELIALRTSAVLE